MNFSYKNISFRGNFRTRIKSSFFPLFYSKLYTGLQFAGYIGDDSRLYNFGRGRYLGSGNFSPKFTEIGNEDNWNFIHGYSNSIYGIKNDGTLWVTGYNGKGQLGLGNTENVVEWTKINNMTGWIKVAVGNEFMIALNDSGELWGAGANNVGQLAQGYTSAFISNLIQISQEGESYIDIAAGDSFFVALRSDGTLWGAGSNNFYQLSNTNTPSYFPYMVQISSDNDWIQIQCSMNTIVALKSNGSLWTKGTGSFGELGQGSNNISPNFVQIGTGFNKIFCSISGSLYAIKNDNTLWVTGRNDFGQLGLGNNNNYNVLTKVNNDTDWDEVGIGNFCAIAKKINGDIFSTGLNSSGQLGLGDYLNRNVFTHVNYMTNVSKVFITDNSNVFIRKGDKIWFSGVFGESNTDVGTVGDFTYRRKRKPINNTVINNDWLMIDSFKFSSIGIRNGKVYTWGENNSGQLGFNNNLFVYSPQVVPGFDNVIFVSSGWESLAFVTEDGRLFVCGLNNYGQLGLGHNNNVSTFTQVSGLNWRMVSCGVYHTMAIKNDGTLWATGANYIGQLGTGNTINRNTFIQIGNDNDWRWVSCGNDFTIALKSDGTIWGTGNNINGQLGLGTQIIFTSFTKIGNHSDWKLVSCGNNFSVGLKKNGSLWSTGNNAQGQLGLGDNINRNTFTLINLPFSSGWVDVNCGNNMFIAKRSNGSIYTTGEGSHYKLGNMSLNNINILTQISQ